MVNQSANITSGLISLKINTSLMCFHLDILEFNPFDIDLIPLMTFFVRFFCFFSSTERKKINNKIFRHSKNQTTASATSIQIRMVNPLFDKGCVG